MKHGVARPSFLCTRFNEVNARSPIEPPKSEESKALSDALVDGFHLAVGVLLLVSTDSEAKCDDQRLEAKVELLHRALVQSSGGAKRSELDVKVGDAGRPDLPVGEAFVAAAAR